MKFSEFLYKSHSEHGKEPSSKRFWGGVMIGCSQIILIAATVLSFIHGDGITNVIKDLIEMDIVVGATLLGLTSVTRIFDNQTITANGPEQEE